MTISTNNTQLNYSYTKTKYQDNTKKDITPIATIIINRTTHNIEDTSVSSLSDNSEDEDNLNLQNNDINNNGIDFIFTETSTTKWIKKIHKE